MENVIYRNSYVESDGYITMEWSGYANSRQFREGTEDMFRQLVKNKASKVLGNIRDMVLISHEDQVWLLEDFVPRAIEAGFRAIAIVQPISYFNKVAIETVAYKINQDQLKIQIFDNMEEAAKWLRSIPV